jgi:uncharacterized membrane protein
MKNILFILLSGLFIASCNLNAPPNDKVPGKLDSVVIYRDTIHAPRKVTGVYRKHYAHFTDCADGKTYIVQNTAMVDSLYDMILPNAYTDQPVYVTAMASFADSDPNAIYLTGNYKANSIGPSNECFKADFWCTGTEPFWTLVISKDLELIDFFDPMTQITAHFAYAEPKIKAGVTYYDATDGENSISIHIRKEKCNGATDKQYDYSAEVKLNGKDYQGCAGAYSGIADGNGIK